MNDEFFAVIELVLIFIAFCLVTILIEGSIMYLMYRNKKYVHYSVLCNVLTNPLLNVTLIFLAVAIIDFKKISYFIFLACLIFLELVVVFIEAFIYKLLCKFIFRKAFFTSLILNASSCILGFAIDYIILLFF